MKKLFILLLFFVPLLCAQHDYDEDGALMFNVTRISFYDNTRSKTGSTDCDFVLTIKENTMKLFIEEKVFLWQFFGNISEDYANFRSKAVDYNGDKCTVSFEPDFSEGDVRLRVMIVYRSGNMLTYLCKLIGGMNR